MNAPLSIGINRRAEGKFPEPLVSPAGSPQTASAIILADIEAAHAGRA
jgi:hypothetical protein